MSKGDSKHRKTVYAAKLTRFLRRLIIGISYAIIILFATIVLRYSSPPPGDLWTQVGYITYDARFDYVLWTLDALGVKIDSAMFGNAPYINSAQQAEIVREYAAMIGEAQGYEREIAELYAIHSADTEAARAATAELRAKRDAIRAEQQRMQPLAEQIIQEQVASVLVDEGLSAAGQELPPVWLHFTRMPKVLVVSPRDEIKFEFGITIQPDTPLEKQVEMEESVFEELGYSAVMDNLGGLSLYPSMIQESGWLPWVFEVTAHEWVHLNLGLSPLGLGYERNPETRIINETTADFFGKEVARRVLARYYPDISPPWPPITLPEPAEPPASVAQESEPPAFDLGRELHETRVRVDELLAAGKIEEAEAHMVQKQQHFVENGVTWIRKLNQAWFAFHGGYQSAGSGYGAGGTDPTGDAVQTILYHSSTLADFINTMRPITTREKLLAKANMP